MGFYFEQLFNHPLRTKSITRQEIFNSMLKVHCDKILNFYLYSSIIATAGAVTSQKLAGQEFNPRPVFAYSTFGLLIAGPFAHYCFEIINSIVPESLGKWKKLLEFLIERFTFAPVFCALSLFFLNIFEGKSVEAATESLTKLYKHVLTANWKYLTLPVFLNFNFVPQMLRVFMSNIIGFFWIIYLADKRRRSTVKKAS